jgi:hypothetical protein
MKTPISHPEPIVLAPAVIEESEVVQPQMLDSVKDFSVNQEVFNKTMTKVSSGLAGKMQALR